MNTIYQYIITIPWKSHKYNVHLRKGENVNIRLRIAPSDGENRIQGKVKKKIEEKCRGGIKCE